MSTRLSRWAKRQMPSREQLEQSRFTRGLARRSELWRLTRRSVPRGVAIGLLVGIFALIPGVQIVGAALMCVPFRANVPIAAGMTFLSNPVTTPLILAGSLYLGNLLGFHADIAALTTLYSKGAGVGEWAAWLLSDAAPALVLGLTIISVAAAAIGYFVTSFVWRHLVMRRRQRRLILYRMLDPAE
ncbi:DUF2062 domain-containing protein [Altericroceibacterium xinjiangense]|uniref:DUF2062 domain-containing protein n=1 Tax=Altericroceibacterium xinjiangense TaxID=762261 RepID=UPI000F7E0C0D|nr:DUF2062 domain-containing protein [Altericroceibacterium xinjiangense]